MMKRVLITVGGVLLVAAVALAAFLRFGPVTVGDPLALLRFMLGMGVEPPADAALVSSLQAPPGLHVGVYARDVPLARMLEFTPAGDLVVSRSRADEVVLLERDRDHDGRSDAQRVLLSGLDGPHGLALRDGWLYVAERTAVGRVRLDADRGTLAGKYQHILTGLTKDGLHVTRTIAFGPDGWLYLAQGSSCNACVEKDPRRATILRMRPDGSEAAIYATGLRNSVGFDWAPWDGAMYATENGRDLLGDDFPPDELNRIEQGRFYGWPFVNGFGVRDPDQGATEQARQVAATNPVHGFRAHNAPLGIHFLRGQSWTVRWPRTALVALHGSWNRRSPDGYEVAALQWQDDGSIVESHFLTGFIGPDGIVGRPADVTEGPDSAIYVSDDYAGVIYRVSFR